MKPVDLSFNLVQLIRKRYDIYQVLYGMNMHVFMLRDHLVNALEDEFEIG